ncbi:MAG: hypothetical protein V4486_00600 [Patescibacteria group bacterium]
MSPEDAPKPSRKELVIDFKKDSFIVIGLKTAINNGMTLDEAVASHQKDIMANSQDNFIHLAELEKAIQQIKSEIDNK